MDFLDKAIIELIIWELKSEPSGCFLPGLKMVFHYAQTILLNILVHFINIGFEVVL